MARRVEPGTMGGAVSDGSSAAVTGESPAMGSGSTGQGEIAAQGHAAALGPFPSYHGRTVSWVAIGIMVVGFLVGGLGLVFGSHGPTWLVFWIGAGLAVLGLAVMIATNTFEDWY